MRERKRERETEGNMSEGGRKRKGGREGGERE